MTLERYVQVATDGSGKKIRNLKVVEVQEDGSEHDVYIQVTALVSPDGKLIDADTTKLLDVIREGNEILEEIRDLMRDLTGNDLRQGISKKSGRYFSMAERKK